MKPFEGGHSTDAVTLDSPKTDHFQSDNGGQFSNLDTSSLAKTPVRRTALEKYAKLYDKNESDFLLNGFLYGFPIQYVGPRAPRDAENLRSTKLNPELIRSKINKEVDAGRVAGPFSQRPLPNLIVSPIGLVPKKTPGEYRMIHHLSYPTGESVNDFIDPASCTHMCRGIDSRTGS